MHGYLRFILAVLVVLSHSNRPGLVNVGIAAVVIFYMLAGYVVTHLLDKHFANQRLINFYLERLLRILPLYWVTLVGALLFVWATGYGNQTLTWDKLLANFTIIPLNYYMFIKLGIVQGVALLVLTPAWSLAVELQAYAILPLILRSAQRKWISGLASLGIASIAAIEVFDPNIWGYRLLPGVLFIFLTGAAISRTSRNPTQADGFDRRFPILCWSWILIVLCGLNFQAQASTITPALGIGFLFGMPIVQFTASSPIRIPFDAVMGRLSYGLFLIHTPIGWVYHWFAGEDHTSNTGIIFVLFVSTLLAAIASFSIEELIWPLRRKITKA